MGEDAQLHFGPVLGARDVQESPSLGPHERDTSSPRKEPSCFGPSSGISVPQPPRGGGRGGRGSWLRFEVPGPAPMLRCGRQCPAPCWAPAPITKSAPSYKKLHPASHSFPVTETLRKYIDNAHGHRKRTVFLSIGGPLCENMCLGGGCLTHSWHSKRAVFCHLVVRFVKIVSGGRMSEALVVGIDRHKCIERGL